MASRLYKHRRQAGKLLACALRAFAGRADAIVLALPRGGVPVGYALAQALALPLDLVLVRKLGLPGHEECAMGAVGSGGVCVLKDELIAAYGVSEAQLKAAKSRELAELARRELAYRGGRPAPELHGRCVILVDDGLATGASMRAAIELVRSGGAAQVIAAAPVGAPDTCAALAPLVDMLCVPAQPRLFYAVGAHYRQFEQVSDEEVRALLARAQANRGASSGPLHPGPDAGSEAAPR